MKRSIACDSLDETGRYKKRATGMLLPKLAAWHDGSRRSAELALDASAVETVPGTLPTGMLAL
jgi:hypothetical protein